MATRTPTLSLSLLLAAPPAVAEDPPDAAVAWAAVFDQTLPQYKKITQQLQAEGPVGPGCAESQSCQQLQLSTWSLLVSLDPQDRRRYSPAWIRIHPLLDKAPSTWVQAFDESAAAPGQRSVAGIVAGSYWVELSIPCTVGSMLPYEAQDLIEHIRAQQPTLTIHPELAWSPCAQRSFETQSLAWLAIEAKIEREQWGILLPQGRVVLEMPD